jgi:hypothetical protein
MWPFRLLECLFVCDDEAKRISTFRKENETNRVVLVEAAAGTKTRVYLFVLVVEICFTPLNNDNKDIKRATTTTTTIAYAVNRKWVRLRRLAATMTTIVQS